MMKALVNGPALEPVALDDMKLYLRLDHDAEDTVVAAIIAAARMSVEAMLDVLLITQTWRLHLDTWPAAGGFDVPFGPVRAIVAARLLEPDGTVTALSISDFKLEAGEGCWRIATPHLPPDGTIELELTVGYGPTPADVPPPLTLAVRALAAHWFEHRGEQPAVGAVAVMPPLVRNLLAPYQRVRLT